MKSRILTMVETREVAVSHLRFLGDDEPNQLYVCEFKISERDVRLDDLARQYHEECDSYDRLICSGKDKRGDVMPASNGELSLINRNASSIIRRMTEVNRDISRGDLLKAIRNHAQNHRR